MVHISKYRGAAYGAPDSPDYVLLCLGALFFLLDWVLAMIC